MKVHQSGVFLAFYIVLKKNQNSQTARWYCFLSTNSFSFPVPAHTSLHLAGAQDTVSDSLALWDTLARVHREAFIHRGRLREAP